jgi:hypothetical protein
MAAVRSGAPGPVAPAIPCKASRVSTRKDLFRKAVEAGVVGIKIDFPPASNRDVSNWFGDTARDAADVHLLLDAWIRTDDSVTRTDHINVDLSPGGGFVGWIRK